jgi:hypothetical protein
MKTSTDGGHNDLSLFQSKSIISDSDVDANNINDNESEGSSDNGTRHKVLVSRKQDNLFQAGC